MNKEVKEKWVAALRSGKYKQTRGTLKDKTGYCCLGVLCEATNSRKWHGYSLLPRHIMKKAGLQNECGTYVEYKNGQTLLTDLNDNRKLTFNDIADIIEKQL